jgi:GT2 family glycosyltransferase
MKIGIGVTTYNRPKHLELWKKQISSFAPTNLPGYYVETYIADDSQDRKGIAYRKNECLRALKDCDYVFLFDDDCFPIKEGWAEFFINACKASGNNQRHFIYLKETPTLKKTGSSWCGAGDYTIIQYNNCSGCMVFFTKEVIEKVGAYNPKYGIYGFEHAGYSNRIHKAGFTSLGAYTCPAGAGEYIYSMDLDNHLPFNKSVKHEPSMAKELFNVPTYIALNKDIYLQDTEIYIPL